MITDLNQADFSCFQFLKMTPQDFGKHMEKAIEPSEKFTTDCPTRTSPLYDRLLKQGAVMDAAHGWERPNYFARKDSGPLPLSNSDKADWFATVGEECRRVSAAVGLLDLTGFAKFELRGREASDFLFTLGTNTPMRIDGRIGLLDALTPDGGVASEFTVSRLHENLHYLNSAAAAEQHDYELLCARASRFEVAVVNRTNELGILSVMGPNSRNLLAPLTDADLSNEAFPWLTIREITLARRPVRALRVSYVGELGWELHMALGELPAVYEAILAAGEQHGLCHFGAYAANSMRLEKGYRAWGLDLTPEHSPLEAGLGLFVKTPMREFTGREGMLARERNSPWRMGLLELTTASPEAQSGESVLVDGKESGIITSGAFGHRTGKNLALAYFQGELPAFETEILVEVRGDQQTAQLLTEAPFDPTNERMRI